MKITCKDCNETIKAKVGSLVTCRCWCGKRGVAIDGGGQGGAIRCMGNLQDDDKVWDEVHLWDEAHYEAYSPSTIPEDIQ